MRTGTRFAVAVLDGGDLFLCLRISRSASGDIYKMTVTGSVSRYFGTRSHLELALGKDARSDRFLGLDPPRLPRQPTLGNSAALPTDRGRMAMPLPAPAFPIVIPHGRIASHQTRSSLIDQLLHQPTRRL
jgi:hypothetical protein